MSGGEKILLMMAYMGKYSNDRRDIPFGENEELLFGKVNWFGGYNSKTGRDNDYGFLSNSTGDFYFHQSQVLSPLVFLVADAKVVFLRAKGRSGKPAADSVRVISCLSDDEVVKLIKNERVSHENKLSLVLRLSDLSSCEGEVLESVSNISSLSSSSDLLQRFWDKFPPSSPVDKYFEYAPILLQEKVRMECMSDDELIDLIKDVGSRSPEEILDIAVRRSEVAPCEKELVEIVAELSRITPYPEVLYRFFGKFPPDSPKNEFFKFAPEIVKEDVLGTLSDASMVSLLKDEGALLPEDVLSIALRRSELVPCEEQIFQAIVKLTDTPSPKKIIDKFWDRFPPAALDDKFLPLAPDRLKRKVYQEHFSNFRNMLDGLFDSVKKVVTTQKSASIYSSLNEQDKRISKIWVGRDDAYDAVHARMLSARAAEKAAQLFYEGVGLSVEDISVKQLEGGGGDWTTHDLLVDSTISVDVKNSRRPVNGRGFYVEHIVPRFKLDRRSVHVRIAGIVSPYLSMKYIEDPSEAEFAIEDIIFLGETSRGEIDRLGSTFNSPTLEVALPDGALIPRWVFNYPVAWYRELSRDVCNFVNECEWPEGEAWDYVFEDGKHSSLIPAICLSGRPLPRAIECRLKPWQLKFFDKLQGLCDGLPSLPFIYLAILTDFLEKLKDGDADFCPSGYVDLIFFERPVDNCVTYPLGAIDPLGIVYELIEVLKSIWGHKDDVNLKDFHAFRFSGIGVLQGRRWESRQWKTIIAYCGGTVYERDEDGDVVLDYSGKMSIKGKCGNYPLVLGDSKSCKVCGWLICGKCGYCSPMCEKKRREDLAERAKKKVENSKAATSSHWAGSEPPVWEEIPLEAYLDDFNRGRR
ncbi:MULTISPECIES: hypothetical protein [Brachymonas]|uniref:hypothetical protein n=1 Tax=Brachymonas TaxID=28219 RepID=UPI002E782C93|nr:hypothetical protein [Brachymonas sp. J145]MEE1652277.1 hypothetical protein [Brachymonas sp. J145]